MALVITLLLASLAANLVSCELTFNESNSLCNKTFADADGYGTFSFTEPFPGGWAWTVLKNETTAQGSLWYSPKGADYADDLALGYDVCFIAVQGVSNFTLWRANSDTGDCHAAFDPVCVEKLNSIARARASLLTANGDSNLTNGDLPSICVDIANTIQGGFPKECERYFDFLTVAGYAMSGYQNVDNATCCTNLATFTQGCHVTGDGKGQQDPFYPSGWLWSTNDLDHYYTNYSRTLVPALNVWMPPANSERTTVATNEALSRITCVRLDQWNEGADRVPPQPRDESPPPTHHGLSGGAIAGIVIGCVAALVILLAVAYWYRRRTQRRQRSAEQVIELEGSTHIAAKTGELDHHEVSEAPNQNLFPEGADTEKRHEMPAGDQKAEMMGDNAAHELDAGETGHVDDKKPSEDGKDGEVSERHVENLETRDDTSQR